MRNGKYQSSAPKKILVTVLALVLLVGCAVGGTIAWITAEADEVTNTFTVGDITIDLKEHKLNTDGTLTTGYEEANLTTSNTYKIVPGATVKKDPFVIVKEGSELCYVYVKITNQLVINGTVAANPNINTTDWLPVDGANGLYRYKEVVDAAATNQYRTVFTEVTYDGALITKDNIGDLADKKIIIDAFAHQSEHTNPDTADKAAIAHFSPTSGN